MEGLDKSLVAEGYSTDPGLHLLWWDREAIVIVSRR
jgi:hypothetical protein